MKAQIQKALEINKNNQSKISFVGLSQGNTQMFAMLSNETDTFFKDKIDLFVACAPIVYMNEIGQSPIKSHASSWKLIKTATLHPETTFYEINYDNIMKEGSPQQKFSISTNMLDVFNAVFYVMIGSEDHADPDAYKLQQHISYLSSSVKQLLHYAQIIATGEFKQYDYNYCANGCEGN